MITAKEIVKPLIDGLFNGSKVNDLLQIQRMSQSNKFKCTECKRIFVREQDLKTHQTRIHGKSNLRALVLKDNRDESNSTCIICNKKFTRAVKMDNHNRKNHEDSDQNYRCDSCKFKTSKSPEMSRHQRDIHKMKNKDSSPTMKKLKASHDEIDRQNNQPLAEIEIMDTSPPLINENEVSALKGNDSSKTEHKIEDIVGKYEIVYNVPGDGLCAINAAAAHIFEDESLGPTLRREMNKHIAKNQSYYINKGYFADVDSPFERKIGNGPDIKFHENGALYEWLDNSTEALFMWSDSVDLLVIANMYKVDIKVITVFNDSKRNPTINWIYPDTVMARQAVISGGTVPPMTLLHKDEIHFDLVINKSCRLAVEGNVRYRISVPTIDEEEKVEEEAKSDESNTNEVIDFAKEIKELKIRVKELTVSHKKWKLKSNIMKKG